MPSAHIDATDQRSVGAYLGDISANILSEFYLALRVEGANRRAMGEQLRRRRHASQRRRVVQRRVPVTILGARAGAGTEEQPRDGRLATRCGEVEWGRAILRECERARVTHEQTGPSSESWAPISTRLLDPDLGRIPPWYVLRSRRRDR